MLKFSDKIVNFTIHYHFEKCSIAYIDVLIRYYNRYTLFLSTST